MKDIKLIDKLNKKRTIDKEQLYNLYKKKLYNKNITRYIGGYYDKTN